MGYSYDNKQMPDVGLNSPNGSDFSLKCRQSEGRWPGKTDRAKTGFEREETDDPERAIRIYRFTLVCCHNAVIEHSDIFTVDNNRSVTAVGWCRKLRGVVTKAR